MSLIHIYIPSVSLAHIYIPGVRLTHIYILNVRLTHIYINIVCEAHSHLHTMFEAHSHQYINIVRLTILLPLETTELTCLDQDRSLVIVTPRYLNWATSSRNSLFKRRLVILPSMRSPLAVCSLTSQCRGYWVTARNDHVATWFWRFEGQVVSLSPSLRRFRLYCGYRTFTCFTQSQDLYHVC